MELFDAKLHNVEIVSIYSTYNCTVYNVVEYKMELLKLQLSLLLKVMLDHAFLWAIINVLFTLCESS